MSQPAIYKCLSCSRVRQIFQPDLGIEKQNGLRQYSDLHRCSDGVLAINNIQIDLNLSVRSVEKVELEPIQKVNNSHMNIPLPSKESIFNKNLSISHIIEKNDLRIKFHNDWVDRTINIGDVRSNEEPLESFLSNIGGISAEYYSSKIELDDNMKMWIKVLINLVEMLPPRKIGFFMEALHFVIDMRRLPPCVYDIHMIQIILLADQIKILKGENNEDQISVDEELSKDHYLLIEMILSQLEQFPDDTLLEFSELLPDDFVFFTFIILIMEKYNVIKLERPLLMDDINMKYIDTLVD